MSRDIFGDDENDDFELTPGGDDSVVAPRVNRPQPGNPTRPSTPKVGLPTRNVSNQRPPLPQTDSTSRVPTRRPGSAIPARTPQLPSLAPVNPVTPTRSKLPSRPPTVERTPPVEPQALPVQPNIDTPTVDNASNNDFILSHNEVEDVVLPDEKVDFSQNYVEKTIQPDIKPNPSYESQSIDQGRLYPTPAYIREQPNERNDNSYDSSERSDRSLRDRPNPQTLANDYDDYSEESRYNQSLPEDDFYREEKSRSNNREKPKKGRTSRAEKPPKRGKKPSKADKGPGKFDGNRKVVMFIRIGALAIALLFVGVGIKSIIVPPPIPSQQDVVNVVKKNLGITNFPTESGNSFVSAFAKEYLTFSPEGSRERKEAMLVYTSDTLASVFDKNSRDLSQKVIEDPIITSTKAVDNSNAIYTIAAKITNGEWMYLEIPIYYNADLNAFSVSGTPAFVAPPLKAELPVAAPVLVTDTKLATTITPDMTNFFTQWATSAKDKLEVYVHKDANIKTRSGLQGSVTFVSLDEFLVEAKDADDPKANVRKATATVTWQNAKDAKILYQQTYDLTLVQDSERKNFFYVADIVGGVSTSSLEKDVEEAK